MELYYQQYPDQTQVKHLDGLTPVIIIPGLFGSTSNWRSFARELSQQRVVYVIDQRNHGRSPHADTQTYGDMVDDLFSFTEQRELDKVVVCGHSMGGKTAMAFSLLHPERVKQLVVVDIAPVTYPHSHAPFLEALLNVELTNLRSRREADQALEALIPDQATRLFLLQSLASSPNGYFWRINLPVLHQFMPEIVSFPSDLDELSSQVNSLFVKGELSNYIVPEYYSQIENKFINTQYLQIAGAGHWVHVDQPNALLLTLLNFLQK